MGPTIAGALISPKTYKRHHAMHSLSCSARSHSNTLAPHLLHPDSQPARSLGCDGQFRCSKAFWTMTAVALTCAHSAVSAANSAPLSQPAGPTAPISAAQLYALPMQFEPNAGQTDEPVLFLSRGRGYTLFLTPTQAVLCLRATVGSSANDKANRQQHKPSAENKIAQAELRMTLLGANAQPRVEGLDQLPGTVNYFVGNYPSQWRSAIPTFAKVKYHQVYPGVDLVYYGNQRQVEYDFLVGAHADPARIAIGFDGADRLEIDGQGDLIAELAGGTVRWHKPVAYQQTEGGRQEIAAKFVLNNRREVGFEIAAYDASRPLIIDPQLVYATYLGGSGSDYIGGITVNGSGNVYVVGDTTSPDFPRTKTIAANPNGLSHVFVTKFGPFGTNLVYSAYIAGSSNDFAAGIDNFGGGLTYAGGIAIDSNGNAFLT